MVLLYLTRSTDLAVGPPPYGLDQKSKMEAVEPKVACRRGSDTVAIFNIVLLQRWAATS